MVTPSSPAPVLWDGVVRLTHWGIAAVVIGDSLLTTGGGFWHVTLGWAGAGLLGLRLVWGVVGRREARFSAFPPDPAAALRHLVELLAGRPREYPSHNPAGAMMVYTLWLSLAVVIGTGLAMTGGATPQAVWAQERILEEGDWSQLVTTTGEGDAAGEMGEGKRDAGASLLRSLHGAFANLLLGLSLLHVGGVVLESRALRRNLVLPMLGGASEDRK